MTTNRLMVLCAVVLCMVGGLNRAEAGNVLIFQGTVTGTSILPGAITLTGASSVTTTDSTTFNAQLTGHTWDVVIYSEMENATYEDSATQLADYLAGGGKLIGFTYRTDGLSVLLGADFAVSSNPYILDNDPVSPIYTTPYTLDTDGQPNNSFVGGHGHTTDSSHGWHPDSNSTGLGNVNFGGFQAILGNSGNSILNATLSDNYDTLSEGERLVANEILFLAPDIAQPVPEPTSLAALTAMTLIMTTRRRRR
ncbi:MAG: PEP-CTERM sorting domain-containing protein [Planctomycetes bacterium]|nr:PEP-CTERM sorting domain-containing protein [Planctomycetota bacterium]